MFKIEYCARRGAWLAKYWRKGEWKYYVKDGKPRTFPTMIYAYEFAMDS